MVVSSSSSSSCGDRDLPLALWLWRPPVGSVSDEPLGTSTVREGMEVAGGGVGRAVALVDGTGP